MRARRVKVKGETRATEDRTEAVCGFGAKTSFSFDRRRSKPLSERGAGETTSPCRKRRLRPRDGRGCGTRKHLGKTTSGQRGYFAGQIRGPLPGVPGGRDQRGHSAPIREMASANPCA